MLYFRILFFCLSVVSNYGLLFAAAYDRATYPCLNRFNFHCSTTKELGDGLSIDVREYVRESTVRQVRLLKRDELVLADMLLKFEDNSCELDSIDAYEKKRGYGSLLIKSLIQDLEATTCSRIQLDSLPEAVDFYKKLGFHQVESNGFFPRFIYPFGKPKTTATHFE